MSKDNIYFVYFHLNPTTQEVFYVGIGSVKSRPYNFGERNPIWKRYVEKHGDPTVKLVHENLTKSQACEMEINYIKQFGRKNVDPNGMLVNISEGGEGGNKGIVWTEDQNKRRSQSNKGKKRSIETRERQSKARLGYKVPQEVIDKTIATRKSRTYPNRSHLLRGKKHKPSFFEKKNKPVYQLSLEGEIIQRFDSITQAENALGYKGTNGGITSALKGKQKTSHGYRWEYAEKTKGQN